MAENKYMELSQLLENYIHEHHIHGRLPGVSKLAAGLHVNHITLRKAIRVLVEQNKLLVLPRDGTYVVEKEAPRRKFHVLGFLGFSYKGEDVEQMFEKLNYTLSCTGYRAMNIACNSQLFDQEPALLTRFPVDCFSMLGAITSKTAEVLLSAKIPAICTVNSNFPEFNHVGMDHVEGYTRAIRLLKEKGCRKIGFAGYKRREEFQNYLEDIHQTFRRELGALFKPKFFQVCDSMDAHKRVGEKYHEVIVNEIIKKWGTDLPDAVITHQDATAFFKKNCPTMKVVEFSTHIFPVTLADISFYEDNENLLKLSAKRMLEILDGDTRITEIRIPFIMVNHTL